MSLHTLVVLNGDDSGDWRAQYTGVFEKTTQCGNDLVSAIQNASAENFLKVLDNNPTVLRAAMPRLLGSIEMVIGCSFGFSNNGEISRH